MRGKDGSVIRSIRGPITLITVGVLFALNNFTEYRFHQTWPVILIVFGALSLIRRTTEPPYTPPPANPYNRPPAPGGSYDPQTGTWIPPQGGATYNAPPASAGRGGFGTTAAPRAADATEDSTPTPGGGV